MKSSHCIVAWVLLMACGDSTEAPTQPQETTRTSPAAVSAKVLKSQPPKGLEDPTHLWIGGDLLISEAIKDAAESDANPARAFAQMLEPAASHWRADGEHGFVIVNLESPVAKRRVHRVDRELERSARSASRQRRAKAIRLNLPAWVLGGLKLAGVHAITLANNHAFDQEAEGLQDTIEAAHRVGLIVMGAGVAPQYRWPVELLDTVVLNAFDGRRNEVVPADNDVAISMMSEAFIREVETASRSHKNVIVIVHVLGELVEQPKPAWQTWARSLANAGASWIVVHGTHVPMKVTSIQSDQHSQVPIAWGLGNFFSDMGRLASPRRASTRADKASFANVRESAMLRITSQAGRPLRAQVLPLFLSDDRFLQWHANRGKRSEGTLQIRFSLSPLPGCGDYSSPKDWKSSHSEEWNRWVTGRRDHLLEALGDRLVIPSRCKAGLLNIEH